MSNENSLEQRRKAALESVERSRRNYCLAFCGAAIWEVVFLAAFLFSMDPHNRLHLLLLIATVGIYTTVILGLITLGVYLNAGYLRLLKAMELLEDALDTPRRVS